MKLNEYQEKALKTCLPQSMRIEYLALGLAAEAGEYANKVKKALRGDYSLQELKEALKEELGGALWYIAVNAHLLGFSLDEIAEYNIAQLRERAENGTIGDTKKRRKSHV